VFAIQKILQNDIPIFGDNIRNIRQSKGMSQSDVVRELQLLGRDMAVSHYGHIEQGRKNIFATDLVLLKIIFNVEYEEFFKGLVSR